MTALYSVGLWRDTIAYDKLLECVQSNRPAVLRSSATALGRIGNKAAVPTLLKAMERETDRSAATRCHLCVDRTKRP